MLYAGMQSWEVWWYSRVWQQGSDPSGTGRYWQGYPVCCLCTDGSWEPGQLEWEHQEEDPENDLPLSRCWGLTVLVQFRTRWSVWEVLAKLLRLVLNYFPYDCNVLSTVHSWHILYLIQWLTRGHQSFSQIIYLPGKIFRIFVKMSKSPKLWVSIIIKIGFLILIQELFFKYLSEISIGSLISWTARPRTCNFGTP